MNHPTIHVTHNFDANPGEPTSYSTNDTPPVPVDMLNALIAASPVTGTLVYYQSYDAIYVGIDCGTKTQNYFPLAFCADGETWENAAS